MLRFAVGGRACGFMRGWRHFSSSNTAESVVAKDQNASIDLEKTPSSQISTAPFGDVEQKKNRGRRRSKLTLKARLDRVALRLNVRSLEDWYQISDKQIRDADPTISHYIYKRDSHGIAAALQAAYPDHAWKPWRFARAPKGFWEDKANHALALADYADQLAVKTPTDWYEISPTQLAEISAESLLNQYNGSMVMMLQALLPSHPWALWQFKHQGKLPNKYWSSIQVQRSLFEQIASDLFHHTSLEGWYDVDFSKVDAPGFASVMTNIYHGNRILALTTIFPEHKWLPWKFKPVDANIWSNQSIVRDYFLWLLDKLGPEANLSTLTPKQVAANCGRGLLDLAKKITKNKSQHQALRFALQRAFPETFSTELTGPNNRASFSLSVDERAASLEGILQVKEHGLDQWYKVTVDQISKLTPWRNPVEMWEYLVFTYPQHEWMPWKFENVKVHLGAKWRDPALQRRFFDWASRALNLSSAEDWYSVAVAQITQLGGRAILRLYSDSVSAALTTVYPDHVWDLQRFKKSKLASAETNKIISTANAAASK